MYDCNKVKRYTVAKFVLLLLYNVQRGCLSHANENSLLAYTVRVGRPISLCDLKDKSIYKMLSKE